MEEQLRRYFLGLVAFGFVAAWAAAGIVTALGAVAACALVTAGPAVVRARTAKRRRPAARPRRTPSELPMVPDDPSLIIELGALG